MTVVNKLKKERKWKSGVVAADNHNAGFGPTTANMFRQLVGLTEVVWEEMSDHWKSVRVSVTETGIEGRKMFFHMLKPRPPMPLLECHKY